MRVARPLEWPMGEGRQVEAWEVNATEMWRVVGLDLPSRNEGYRWLKGGKGEGEGSRL